MFLFMNFGVSEKRERSQDNVMKRIKKILKIERKRGKGRQHELSNV